MDKQATLKDIAKRANVSVSTVSRVVNGTASKAARPEIQKKIWDAVKELNYIPNSAAQSLKTSKESKKLRTIACIFSRSANYQNDPFFSEISRSIESELLKRGYLMKFSVSTYEHPKETIDSLFLSEKVDGVIILGRIDRRYLELIQRFNKNIVYSGLNKLNYEIDQVICNGYDAALLALKHIDQWKPKFIYYLGETNNEVRYASYRDFMNKKGVVANLRKYVIESEFSSQSAYEKLLAKLRSGIVPEAIFCGNDLTALGAIKAIKEFGLSSPEDIKIVSIDNIEMAQFSSPMLTTVSVPMDQIGRIAAKLVVDHAAEKEEFPMIISIPPKLIVRESS